MYKSLCKESKWTWLPIVWLENMLHLPLWALLRHWVEERILGNGLGYRDWRLGMNLAPGD